MARNAAFDLLMEMARGCKENYLELQKLLLRHHISGKGFAVFVKLQHRWPQVCHGIKFPLLHSQGSTFTIIKN